MTAAGAEVGTAGSGDRTIVVGTDGGPLAGPTVDRAAWLANRDGAYLVIVCAYSDLSRRDDARMVATSGGDSRIGHVFGKGRAEQALAEAVEIARSQKATVMAAVMLDSTPAEALLRTSTFYDAVMIVLGAHRATSIADRLLGTVVAEVVRRATCDVLIVRPREAR